MYKNSNRGPAQATTALTRANHRFVPLHPHARDTRAAVTLPKNSRQGPASPATDDSPLSSEAGGLDPSVGAESSSDSGPDSHDIRTTFPRRKPQAHAEQPRRYEDFARKGQKRKRDPTSEDNADVSSKLDDTFDGFAPIRVRPRGAGPTKTYLKQGTVNIHAVPEKQVAQQTFKAPHISLRDSYGDRDQCRSSFKGPRNSTKGSQNSPSQPQFRDTRRRDVSMEQDAVKKSNLTFKSRPIATAALHIDDISNDLNSSDIKSSEPFTNISSSPLSQVSSVSTPPQTVDHSPLEPSHAFDPTSSHMDQAECPLCKELVDLALLEEFTLGRNRLLLREQTAFCKAHRRKEADTRWVSSGLPEIRWNLLNRRFQKHHIEIEGILDGHQSSTFRDALSRRVESGKDRTLFQAMSSETNSSRNLTPGYYGSRGARLMTENLMSAFSRKLRASSATDPLIASGGGVSSYVQAVLVPELAVRLICDDMSVGMERAKELLEQTSELGELLNEEEEDMAKVLTRQESERDVFDV